MIRKDELRDLNSLRSRAKAVFLFVTRLCFLGLCLQGLIFRVFENADPASKDLENTAVSQTLCIGNRMGPSKIKD